MATAARHGAGRGCAPRCRQLAADSTARVADALLPSLVRGGRAFCCGMARSWRGMQSPKGVQGPCPRGGVYSGAASFPRAVGFCCDALVCNTCGGPKCNEQTVRTPCFGRLRRASMRPIPPPLRIRVCAWGSGGGSPALHVHARLAACCVDPVRLSHRTAPGRVYAGANGDGELRSGECQRVLRWLAAHQFSLHILS